MTISACIFCSAPDRFSSRRYGDRPIPANWPKTHVFQGKTIAVCTECGGGFVREEMTDEDISAFYSAVFEVRQDSCGPQPEALYELTPRFLSQSLYLKSFIDLTDGMRVLEFGPNVVSALPTLSLFCRPRYYYFDQLDSSIIASYGGRRLGAYASGAEIIRHLGKGGLDLVYASHSLEHVNPVSLDELFAGIATAVAPGGHVFFEVPDDLSIDMVLVPHSVFFSEASIRRLLDRHGFEVVHLGRWDKKAAPTKEVIGSGSRTNGQARAKVTAALRKAALGIPLAGRALRPVVLQRGLRLALRQTRTPYESTPYFRAIARKR